MLTGELATYWPSTVMDVDEKPRLFDVWSQRVQGQF
jgi:hypothetical protein